MQSIQNLEIPEQKLEESLEKSFEKINSAYETPEQLESEYRKLNQFKTGHEPFAGFGVPIGIFSGIGALIPEANLYKAAILSANLGPAYAAKNVYQSQRRQNEIENELENWKLYENDFNLSQLFEEAEPIRGFNTAEDMQASYEVFQEDFKHVENEIQELANSNRHDDNFVEELDYALQAVRFEEDDFGTVEFQVNMYLDGDEIAVYHGHTKDRAVVEGLQEQGLKASENTRLLKSHFDLPNPLDVRYTKP